MNNLEQSSNATSLTLIEKVRAADQNAWHRIVLIYSPLLFHWGQRARIESSSIQDIVQEVWQAVWKKIGSFERTTESGSFRAWLWTITRNRIIDHCRKKANQHEIALTEHVLNLNQLLPETEPEEENEAVDQGIIHRTLEMIREDFNEATWKAFWRTTIDGISAADAGAELGMNANAVYQAKSRVLRRLREELA
ncbi:MAG: sigma-70 family RNA polymerase sigma factor [Zavarzinella sp.]